MHSCHTDPGTNPGPPNTNEPDVKIRTGFCGWREGEGDHPCGGGLGPVSGAAVPVPCSLTPLPVPVAPFSSLWVGVHGSPTDIPLPVDTVGTAGGVTTRAANDPSAQWPTAPSIRVLRPMVHFPPLFLRKMPIINYDLF